MVAAPLTGRLPRDSKKEDENWRRRSVLPRRGSVTSSTAGARSRRARIFGCADFFCLSDGYSLRALAAYDIEVALRDLGGELEKIKPWSGTAT